MALRSFSAMPMVRERRSVPVLQLIGEGGGEQVDGRALAHATCHAHGLPGGILGAAAIATQLAIEQIIAHDPMQGREVPV